MQGLTVDALTSKRIPASRMISFQRTIAGHAPEAIHANPNLSAALATEPSAAMAAAPAGARSHSALTTDAQQSVIYDGTMTISGGLTAGSGQTGRWSGTMSDEIVMLVDRNGNGSGGETFSGNVTLTVTNPDGTQKSNTAPLDFFIPFFTVKHGHFKYSDSSGFDYSGLFGSLNVGGSFAGSHATISEKLTVPFGGFVNGTSVSGKLLGSGLLRTTAPLITISGADANQLAGGKITPFRKLVVTDLNNATVTATVTLSNAHNGTLSNLAGGSYKPARGTYTISGSQTAVNSALEGLIFKPAKLKPGSSQLTTGFTLTVTDSQGASLTNSSTSVVAVNPVSVVGVFKHLSTTDTKRLSLFRNTVVHDFVPGARDDTVKVTLSNPKNGTLEALDGGTYHKVTGVFLAHGSAATVTNALRGLEFIPTQSSKSSVTTVTLLAKDSTGSFTGNTTIAVSPAKPATMGADVALFSQYVALGLHAVQDHATAISPLRDQFVSARFELASSHR